MEKTTIKNALAKSNGNKSEAARLLGINRRTLYNKMEKYGLAVRGRPNIGISDLEGQLYMIKSINRE